MLNRSGADGAASRKRDREKCGSGYTRLLKKREERDESTTVVFHSFEGLERLERGGYRSLLGRNDFRFLN